jgi:uncharacterized protein YoxC
MTGSDIAIIIGLVLCIVAFAALVVVLFRVLQALTELRHDLSLLHRDVVPLLSELRSATTETRHIIDDAREDLARFDRVLGSAESISEAVADTSRVARTVLSAPVIKVAALASGTKQAVSSLAGKGDKQDDARSSRRAKRSAKRRR